MKLQLTIVQIFHRKRITKFWCYVAIWQSDKEWLLFEGVTNIKYTRLSHKSQIKGRIKSGMIYPPKP